MQTTIKKFGDSEEVKVVIELERDEALLLIHSLSWELLTKPLTPSPDPGLSMLDKRTDDVYDFRLAKRD